MSIENIIFKIYEFLSNKQPPELRCPQCDSARMQYKTTIKIRKIENAIYMTNIYECRRCKKQD
ncbi:MAG: hypothetical protein N3G19_02065 [Candidatus Pacearchaeota archaeon]|nr:hypothetical protein [Candidatus Pacearchaeota archaeon]